MRKFSKINESIEDKDPIDPSEDVKEFKEKFTSGSFRGSELSDIEKNTNPWLDPNSRIAKIFAQIESSYPTMTDEYETYRVHRLDDNGRVLSVLGYFKAVSENHARIRAAIFKNNKEILLTGYYSAYKGANIDEEIKIIEDNIKKLQKDLDELKNPI
jgi:hypothetical protein